MKHVVELGLRNPEAPAPTEPPQEVSTANTAPLKGLVEAFLKAFADFAPSADEKDVKDFAAKLADFRAQIRLADHDQEVRQLAAGSVKACEQFLRRSRHYYTEREAELTEMVAMLRGIAQHVAGESAQFNDQVLATGDRVSSLVHLEDIRELKRRLVDEATTLKDTVRAKQKRDEETVNALNERVQTLQAHLDEAAEQATLDPLTKILNRGAFDRALDRMIKGTRTSRVPLTLAMIDIDHFKAINDTHGHLIGDRVLLCAAQWLSGAVRPTDVVARYGGEEFVVILADADLASAETRLRAVLGQIASRMFEYESDGVTKSIQFTVSCGISQLAPQDTQRDLLHRADEALYDAKRQGRNRVVARKRSLLGGLFG